jgi:epoxyqueuosine reductase
VTPSRDATDANTAADAIRRIGLDAGLDAVGIAPATPFERTRRLLDERKADGLHGGMQFTYRNPSRSTDASQTLPGAAALVVGARSYRRTATDADTSTVADPGGRGRVARYSWTDHSALLRHGLQAIADHLVHHGHQARVLADDNALVDREAAYRAGLGTYGKNTQLLLHGRGSEFVLGAVVTDAPLPHHATDAADADDDEPRSACGTCDRCLPACPTGALAQPGVLDANRCLAWLVQQDGTFPREHRAALGDRLYGCDDCQDVCPPNRLEVRRTPPPRPEPGSEPTVDVLAILEEPDDDVLLDRHGRWYIALREARYLRRNALVVLGNVGDLHDARTTTAVTRALAARDPLVRGHAVWAAARLGRHDQLPDGDDDPDVRDELGALPPPRQA